MVHTQDYYRHHSERLSKNRNELYNMLLPQGEEDWKTYDSRWAKHHPFDCGNPRCLTCHHKKVLEKRRFTLSETELEHILSEEDMEL